MMNDVSKNLTVGLVGWRGMVGSVLMERMVAENDFDGITPVFFSTSNAGGDAPTFANVAPSKLQDANDISELALVKVATTPKPCISHCVIAVGQATGLMQRVLYV